MYRLDGSNVWTVRFGRGWNNLNVSGRFSLKGLVKRFIGSKVGFRLDGLICLD